MLDDISQLFGAPRDEQAQIDAFNDTATEFQDGLIDELILRAPFASDSPCCCFGEMTLDRKTFFSTADAIAGALQASNIARGDIVAIAMPPSPGRLLAVFATLRVGAVFLPIDHGLPDDRISGYLTNSRAKILIVDSDLPERVCYKGSFALLPVAKNGSFNSDGASSFRAVIGRTSADWSYVVYTSGTTGKPKAAINNHRAIVNRLLWMARDVSINVSDRVCHKTPFGFDVGIWEQLLPLLTGAVVVIAEDDLRLEPARLVSFFHDADITLAHFVPSQLAEFVRASGETPPPTLRHIIASGEALPATIADAVMRWPNVNLHNYYGPSEAAIDVTGLLLDTPVGRDVSIGAPIQNCRIHILDRFLAEVPIGAVGEIYIGGDPVGNGYLHAPRISAARFVPDPFSKRPGAALYRTGDVARWRKDGRIDFLGRNDRQLKLRGLRIEPGEIESVLADITGNPSCLVEPVTAPSGAVLIVGFVVTDAMFDEDEVIAALRTRLPLYMVPARIFGIRALPLSQNGKADVKALLRMAEPMLRGDDREDDPVTTQQEITLATAWTTLLRRPVDSRTAHFFKLGGDSITAIRLVALLRKNRYRLETKDVFDHPQLGALADRMQPLNAEETPLTGYARAIRQTTAEHRALLVPAIHLSRPSPPDGAVIDRMAEMGLALRPDLKADDAVCWTESSAVAHIAGTPNCAIAVERRPDQSLIVAFDPSVVDDMSAQPLADWLIAGGPAPRVERNSINPVVFEPLASVATSSGDIRHGEKALPQGPHPWTETASAERHIDFVCAALLACLRNTSPTTTIASRLPESRTPSIGSGPSPERPVGRLGITGWWSGETDPSFDDIACARGRGANVSALDGGTPVVAFRRLRQNGTAVEAKSLADPLLAHGEIAAIIASDRVHLFWPSSIGEWPMAALEEFQIASAEIEAVYDRRYAFDFAIVDLDSQSLAALPRNERIEDAYPLAPLQEGMLMRAAYWPESDAYLNQNIIELHGPLSTDSAIRAWSFIVERYEVLRTAYHWAGRSQPLAVVDRNASNTVEFFDWTEQNDVGFEKRLDDFLQRDRSTPFDLTRPGLWRLRLIRRSPDLHVLVWTHHHILLDGWCLALIWGDFARAYAACSTGVKDIALSVAPRPYRDFIGWLARNPPGEVSREYWEDQLRDAQACALSTHPVDIEGVAATRRVPLPACRKAALDQACAAIGVTANAFIQAAWSLLIALRLARTDVVHGVSISGRPPEMVGSEAMVGLFINAVPLRISADPRMTAYKFIHQVQVGLATANRHGTLPLPEILSRWQGRKSPDERLFDSLIAFENYPDENLPTSEVAGVRFEDRFCDEKTEYPIGLIVLPGDPFEVHFNYDSAHFQPHEIDQICADYLDIFNALIDRPKDQLSTFALASRMAAASLPVPAGPKPVDLALLLIDDKPEMEDYPAVEADGTIYSRAELKRRVEQAAAQFVTARTDTVVAILAPRSIEYVIAVLAAWRLGVAPLVINPALPDLAIRKALDAAGASRILTDITCEARARTFDLPIQRVSGTVAEPSEKVPPLPAPAAIGKRTAAILLTSGSSGAPKLVIVPGDGFGRRVAWTCTLYDCVAPRLLANAAPGFDIGLWEIAWPLSQRGSIVLANENDMRDPCSFEQKIIESRIDALHVTPTFASSFVDRPVVWSDIKVVVTGGEVVTPALVKKLTAKMPNAQIWQGYGPSEASVTVTDHLTSAAQSEGRVPLGKAMDGCSLHILDQAMRPCLEGIAGRIYLGGPALSTGYLADPRQTASAFVPNPFGASGDRLYDTGDTGRWLSTGLLEFSGRADRQVKIRGFRVELDGVERCLQRHAGVRQAAVLASGSDDEAQLNAYVALMPGAHAAGVDEVELRNWQLQHLPRWSVAHRIVILDKLPESRNDKLDYDALRSIISATTSAARADHDAQPLSPVESIIANCWESAVGSPPADRHANFFESGGHSMTAMRMIALLQKKLGSETDVRVPMLFKFPTVAGLAEALLTPVDGSGGRHMTQISEGAGPPLILIHPVEGLSFAYRPLAAALHHGPVWTIDDPRMEADRPFGSLHDMAELYVEWVRNRFQDTQFVLGGWSFGGAVALEMASIIARHDIPPLEVLLIDSYNLAGSDPSTVIAKGALEKVSEPDDTNEAAFATLRREIQHNGWLAINANPPIYPHPVTLVRAMQQEPELVAKLGLQNGWESLCTTIETVEIDGDHHSIFESHNIKTLSDAVDQVMKRVSAANDLETTL